MIYAPISWRCDWQDPGIYFWNVYASEVREHKGERVGRVGADDRSCVIEVLEGVYYIRVLYEKHDGSEEDWRSKAVEVLHATAQLVSPGTPQVLAVGYVEPSLQARATIEPPARDVAPHFLQVVDGPSGSRGVLVGEARVVPRGPLGPDGARIPTVTIPMEGRDEARTVILRAMGAEGLPSSDVSRTVRSPPMETFHAVALASVSGTTLVGFPAAVAADGFEYDATDGLRLKAFGCFDDIHNDWNGFDGTMGDCDALGAFMDHATVESNELDVGVVCTFRLSIKDTTRRKDAVGAFDFLPFDGLLFPLFPHTDPEIRPTEESYPWAARELSFDGTQRQPIRHRRWQYVVGDSTSVPHADADYRDYVSGEWIRGRYVRVRLVVREPFGLHQIICPTITVEALIPRRFHVGSGTPEAAVTAPPGSHFLRTNGPPHHYVKMTGVGNTGWVAPVVPQAVSSPPGVRAGAAADVTAFANQKCYAVYLGKAIKDNPTVDVQFEITTAAVTPVWGEAAVATGPYARGANPTLTVKAPTHPIDGLAASPNHTAHVTSGVAAGDDLWFLLASDAATPMQFRADLPDILAAGVVASKASTRPSTMGAAVSFTLDSTSAPPRVIAIQT